MVHISDTHLKHSIHIPDGDILIHTGDWSMKGTDDELYQFVNWLSSLPHQHKVVIAGNHDFICEIDEPFARQVFLKNGIIYLQDQEVTVEGIRIWGSPWSNQYGNWSFQRGEAGLSTIYEKIPNGIDILATHGPAFDILDEANVYNYYLHQDEKLSVGSRNLTQAIERIRPQFVLCGHIHEGYGRKTWNGITFLNSSILDDFYRVKNAPQTFKVAPKG